MNRAYNSLKLCEQSLKPLISNYSTHFIWFSDWGFKLNTSFAFLIATERNWVFATNLNVLIPISLQPDGLNLKLKLFDLTEFIVWNI